MKRKKSAFLLSMIVLVCMLSAMAAPAFADDGVKPSEFWGTVNEYASWPVNERAGYSVDMVDSYDGMLPDGMWYEIDSMGRLLVCGTPSSVGNFRVDFTLEVNDGNNSWGTGLMCIFHIEGNPGREDYSLPTYYGSLDAGKNYWITFDMDSVGNIDNYRIKGGNLPEGMYGDMDRNGVYLGGTPTRPGTYTFTFAAHNSYYDCWVSQPVSVTVGGDVVPVITKNPTSETIVEGGSTLFIAKADNANSVTWYLVSPDSNTTIKASDAPGRFSGMDVSGTSSENFYLGKVPLSLNGWKAVAKFSNAAGTVSSNSATISVKKAELKEPVINTPPSGLRLNPGESGVLNITASSPDGNVLKYQWYKTENKGNNGGTAIPNATSPNLTVSYEVGTFYYYCVVTNAKSGDVSAPVSSAAAEVVGLVPATPSPSPSVTPTASPENTAQPTQAPEQDNTGKKEDHTVALIVGGVAAVAIICATLIIIQRGAARRYPDKYSEQIERARNMRRNGRDR